MILFNWLRIIFYVIEDIKEGYKVELEKTIGVPIGKHPKLDGQSHIEITYKNQTNGVQKVKWIQYAKAHKQQR